MEQDDGRDGSIRLLSGPLLRKSWIVRKESRRLSPRLAVQIAKRADLSPVPRQVDRQVEAEKMAGHRTCLPVRTTGLPLQATQRQPTQRANEPGAKLVKLPQVSVEVQRHLICRPSGGVRVLVPVVAPNVSDVPRRVDPKMSHDQIDSICFGHRPPINLFRRDILEILLEAVPGVLVQLDRDLKRFIHIQVFFEKGARCWSG